MDRVTISNLRFRLIGALILLAVGVANAQVVDPQNVLIRNVHLIQGSEANEGVLVSVLIRDNKLEIVSKDVLRDE